MEEEMRNVSTLAVPSVITNTLAGLMALVDIIMLGHIGKTALAAGALAITIYNCCWFFLLGFCTGIDTLVSQAFGAKDFAAVKQWTNVAYVLIFVLCIPTSVILCFAHEIARTVFSQPEDIAEQTGSFCRILIPGLWFVAAFTVLQKSQQAQNLMMPSVYIGVVANCFNILGNYVFIWGIGLGLPGSPLATTASRVFMFLALLWYDRRYLRDKNSVHREVPAIEDMDDSDDDIKGDAGVNGSRDHTIDDQHGDDDNNDGMNSPRRGSESDSLIGSVSERNRSNTGKASRSQTDGGGSNRKRRTRGRRLRDQFQLRTTRYQRVGINDDNAEEEGAGTGRGADNDDDDNDDDDDDDDDEADEYDDDDDREDEFDDLGNGVGVGDGDDVIGNGNGDAIAEDDDVDDDDADDVGEIRFRPSPGELDRDLDLSSKHDRQAQGQESRDKEDGVLMEVCLDDAAGSPTHGHNGHAPAATSTSASISDASATTATAVNGGATKGILSTPGSAKDRARRVRFSPHDYLLEAAEGEERFVPAAWQLAENKAARERRELQKLLERTGFNGGAGECSILAILAVMLPWDHSHLLHPQATRRLRHALSKFVHLGIPGGIMVGLEAWSFEITTIFAAQLGTVALDGHAIMLNVCGFTFAALPYALSNATSIRIGNLIGAEDPVRARRAAWLCIALGALLMTVSAILLTVFRYEIGRAFSNDKDVVAMVAYLAPMVAFFQVADGVQGVAQGVLRGLGRQKLIAVANLIAFWVIGVPGGAVLTFVANVGVAGLWWGFVLGLGAEAIILVYIIHRVEWEDEVVYAREARMHNVDTFGADIELGQRRRKSRRRRPRRRKLRNRSGGGVPPQQQRLLAGQQQTSKELTALDSTYLNALR